MQCKRNENWIKLFLHYQGGHKSYPLELVLVDLVREKRIMKDS